MASDSLALALAPLAIDVVIDDAESWIPDKTGFWEDRKVNPKLKDAIKGFDLVHAWGFRSAWACGESLYVRFPWVYTAFDWPRTKNTLLIDRLNHARLGICTSRALKNELDDVYAMNLETVVPAVDKPLVSSREMARGRLGLSEDDKVAACMADTGRVESGLEAFVAAIAALPGVVGLINVSAEDLPPNVRVVEKLDMGEAIAAADLLVEPATSASFSIQALVAMQLGVPVVMRMTGGLPEMGVEGIHYFGFGKDEELSALLRAWAEGSRQLRGTEDAASTRASSWLTMEECGRRHADLYRRVLNG